ncbi:MAG: GatB/YqeY domain-containing protein [Betaproteobacteria bacterium AqS2]|uniref:GatB/YqeY domain-containing protein n=1 Tax=Candidatus Amphirhobacter heronislandensis TaxID=1732024 RepID=A0A930UFP1_9GAMM|nr:GatB/YqeY domain-containing protein [Betaproteobacteria bacterium AqS2]
MGTETETRIAADLKAAMKARDAKRRGALKLLKAAIDKARIDADLDEAKVHALIASQRKQRLEAAELYAANGDAARKEQEEYEAALLAEYLPAQLDDAEVEARVDAAIAAAQAEGPRDMGKVMALLAKELGGAADMKQVSAKVKARLAG